MNKTVEIKIAEKDGLSFSDHSLRAEVDLQCKKCKLYLPGFAYMSIEQLNVYLYFHKNCYTGGKFKVVVRDYFDGKV